MAVTARSENLSAFIYIVLRNALPLHLVESYRRFGRTLCFIIRVVAIRWVISGFRRGVNEIYIAWIRSCRRFGTTYRVHLQASSSLLSPSGKIFRCLSKAWPLKMEPVGCPETSVTTNLRGVISQKSEDLSCGMNCLCDFKLCACNKK